MIRSVVALMGGEGSTGVLDTQTVTVGDWMVGGVFPAYGYSASGGSINDGTSNIYGGAAITDFYALDTGSWGVVITISGNRANSGWTKVSIGGADYLRSSATYTPGGSETSWGWPGGGSNPFGTTIGATVDAVFS